MQARSGQRSDLSPESSMADNLQAAVSSQMGCKVERFLRLILVGFILDVLKGVSGFEVRRLGFGLASRGPTQAFVRSCTSAGRKVLRRLQWEGGRPQEERPAAKPRWATAFLLDPIVFVVAHTGQLRGRCCDSAGPSSGKGLKDGHGAQAGATMLGLQKSGSAGSGWKR